MHGQPLCMAMHDGQFRMIDLLPKPEQRFQLLLALLAHYTTQ